METRDPILVGADRFRTLCAVGRNAGAPVDRLLADLGLDPALIDAGPLGKAPLAQYFRLQQRLGEALEDETCQLSARQILPGSTDFVMARLGPRGTLADAMQAVANAYNLLHGGAYNTVRRAGGSVVYEIDDRRFPYTVTDDEAVWFSLEGTLVFLHAILTLIDERGARNGLQRVEVRRPPGAGEAEHLRLWSCPVTFGAPVYAIRYAAAAATTPIDFPPGDFLTSAAIYARIVDLIEAPATPDDGGLRRAVQALLAEGVSEQDEAARRLAMSPATLRRRLAMEGASFRALREAVLNRRAQRLLREGWSIASVSEALGFSDFRSFSRAFKAWNGTTPRAWREAIRG